MNTENKPIFRFKTKKEFRAEFGNDWRENVLCCWDKERMDKFLNTFLPGDYNIDCLKLWMYDVSEIKHKHGFWISRDMIKPITNEQ